MSNIENARFAARVEPWQGRRHRIGPFVWLLSGILSAAVSFAVDPPPERAAPVALTHVGGHVHALGSRGGIYRLDEASRSLRLMQPLRGILTPIDLASTETMEKQILLLMTFPSQVSGFKVPQILIYESPKGDDAAWGPPARSIPLIPNALFLGLAASGEDGYVYFAAGESGDIYRARFTEPKAQVQVVARIPRVPALGPMTIDVRAGTLYVAATLDGRVLQVDLRTGRFSDVATDLGQPLAIALSPDGSVLYAPDSIQRVLWAIPIGSRGEKRAIYAFPDLETVYAVTTTPEGEIWIGDQETDSFVKLSATGEELARFVPEIVSSRSARR